MEKVVIDGLEGFRALAGGTLGTSGPIEIPQQCGARLTQTVKIDRVEEPSRGIAVFYDVTWNVEGEEQPVAVAVFIIRYID